MDGGIAKRWIMVSDVTQDKCRMSEILRQPVRRLFGGRRTLSQRLMSLRVSLGRGSIES